MLIHVVCSLSRKSPYRLSFSKSKEQMEKLGGGLGHGSGWNLGNFTLSSSIRTWPQTQQQPETKIAGHSYFVPHR